MLIGPDLERNRPSSWHAGREVWRHRIWGIKRRSQQSQIAPEPDTKRYSNSEITAALRVNSILERFSHN